MNSESSAKSSFLASLLKFFRYGDFHTVHATTQEEADDQCPCGGGDAPQNPPEREEPPTQPSSLIPCPTEFAQEKYGQGDGPCLKRGGGRSKTCKKSTCDRGLTGAGVTGSRCWDGAPGPTGSALYALSADLPRGARNPGLLRYIHNAARYRLPQCFEGGCLNIKQSSQCNWVLGHSMSFSSVSPGGYKLLLSYVDKKQPESPPLLVVQAAPGGQLSCEVRVGPTYGTRASIITQVADGEFYNFESIFDAYFSSATASVIAVNRDFIALHYLQALSKNLSMGVELVARGHAAELSSASAAARWSTKCQAVSMTLGSRGVDVCYAKSLKPFLTVAAMLEVGFAVRRALGTLAYEWRSCGWLVRASVDSEGLVGATLHRNLGGKNADLSCAISALLNHPNNKFRLGFGVTAVIL